MNDMSHSEPRCQSLVEDRICRILSPSAFGVRGLVTLGLRFGILASFHSADHLLLGSSVVVTHWCASGDKRDFSGCL